MTTSTPTFPAASFVKARLLREPVYREDGALWDTLRAQADEIRHYFRQIGQELILDEGDGFAFIRQIEIEADEPVPRLVQSRALGYLPTLLLVCLREELLRFDGAADDSVRLVKTRAELQNLVAAFTPESTNEVRDLRNLDLAIKRLTDLGFLRALPPDGEALEVMRIIKARLRPDDLQAIRDRLLKHVPTDR